MTQEQPLDGPLWPWETERHVAATELLTWAAKVPTVRLFYRHGSESQSNPRMVGGRLIGSIRHPGFVFGASPEDGKILWRHAIEHFTHQHIATDDDHIYVSAPNHLRSIRAADGRTRWKYLPSIEGNERLRASPLVHGDGVYLLDRSGALQRIDKENGKGVWRTQIAGVQQYSTEAPIVVGDLVVTRTDYDGLTACEVSTGRIAWTLAVKFTHWINVQLHFGRLVAEADDGFSLISAEDGTIGETWSSGEEVVEGCLATPQGVLVALRSAESLPTPSSLPMQYSPQRLVLIEDSRRERWSLAYPPYSKVHLRYDLSLGIAIESTRHDVGFVDVKAGTRKCVVYEFPGGPEDETFPCYWSPEGSYGLTKAGILFSLRFPLSD